MARIGRYRADDVPLHFGGGHRLQMPFLNRQLDPLRMVAGADHEQHLVTPCEPVQQAGERTEGLIE